MPVRGALLFAYLLISLPICFFRPFYGVLVWAVIGFLNPQASLFYWSVAASFPWAIAIAAPTLIGFVFFSRGWLRQLVSREVLLILALWVWFTITSLMSAHNPLFVHHAEDTWYRWGFVSKILLMTAVTIAIVNSFERLRIFLLVIAGCFGYFVLKAFPFILMTGGAYRVYGPPQSMIADNNDFGLALNMTLPLFFFLAKTEERPAARWFFGILSTLTIPAIFFTWSRGAVVGLVAVGTLMLLQSKQRLVLIPVIVIGVAIALLFAPEAWKNRMDPSRPGALDNSAQERLNAWAFARNLAAEFPITGGGFATFTPELFGRYAPQAMDIHGPHSIYFQVLAEHGFPGLFLYLGLVFSCFATLRQVLKRSRYYGDTDLTYYANMLQFSLYGFLVSGTFLGRAYFDYFFSIVACITILHRVAMDRWAQIDEQITSASGSAEAALPMGA